MRIAELFRDSVKTNFHWILCDFVGIVNMNALFLIFLGLVGIASAQYGDTNSKSFIQLFSNDDCLI